MARGESGIPGRNLTSTDEDVEAERVIAREDVFDAPEEFVSDEPDVPREPKKYPGER